MRLQGPLEPTAAQDSCVHRPILCLAQFCSNPRFLLRTPLRFVFLSLSLSCIPIPAQLFPSHPGSLTSGDDGRPGPQVSDAEPDALPPDRCPAHQTLGFHPEQPIPASLVPSTAEEGPRTFSILVPQPPLLGSWPELPTLKVELSHHPGYSYPGVPRSLPGPRVPTQVRYAPHCPSPTPHPSRPA